MAQVPLKTQHFCFLFIVAFFFLILKQFLIVVILGGLGQKKGGLDISYMHYEYLQQNKQWIILIDIN
jgi:hypothetical protein